MRQIYLAVLFATCFCTQVYSYLIPSGCPRPPSTLYQKAYYIDPLKGSDLGDGSKARPWKSLQKVIDSRLIGFQAYPAPYPLTGTVQLLSAPTQAVVKPGSTIYLMSGNYGDIVLKQAFNSEFIEITAYPGQKPVFTSLYVRGASKWIFTGISFEGLNRGAIPSTSFFASIRSDYYYGPLDNILIQNSHFQTQADVSTWTRDDWAAKRVSGISEIGGNCISIYNNTFKNVGFGIGVSKLNLNDSVENAIATGRRVRVANNTIDYFSCDGIDYNANDLLIEYNKITNSVDDGNTIHRDAMQGQPFTGSELEEISNLTIQGNTVINQTDPKLPYPGALQGIDTFDGVWSRVQIRNNLVITNAYHGIAYYNIHDAIIINNTVLNNPVADPYLSPTPATLTWIYVANAKSGTPSTNVIVRNNISEQIRSDTVTTIDHNIARQSLQMPINGKAQYLGKTGIYDNQNEINPNLYAGFVSFDTKLFSFNLKLLSSSPAVGFGSSTAAPAFDIIGIQRKTPVDVGAYAFK